MGLFGGLGQVLGLPAGPVEGGDQASCNLVGRAYTEIAPNDVQAQVQTAAAPAEVRMHPSSTNSTLGSTVIYGNRCARSSVASHWVVAASPSSSTASARANAP